MHFRRPVVAELAPKLTFLQFNQYINDRASPT